MVGWWDSVGGGMMTPQEKNREGGMMTPQEKITGGEKNREGERGRYYHITSRLYDFEIM